MNIIINLLILGLLGLIVYLVVTGFRKGTSTVKVMLLGINLTLFGGILVVDPHSNVGGVGYLVALIGVIISAIGFRKND